MIEPYYQDSLITEYHGHVLPILKQMEPESVHSIVTSPPYWGLRDYGLEPQIWDGDVECEHEWGDESIIQKRGDPGGDDYVSTHKKDLDAMFKSQGQFCLKCSAWRGSLGLEPTPELYIQHLVQIFRELKRVLRKDGTCWLNIGDSYAGSGCGTNDYRTEKSISLSKPALYDGPRPQNKVPIGLKPKDLCLIPSRVALALQADGWWLRSDIIWSKPNPMPESVTDRPTNSYEHVFLLTKSGKYFYDADAVREPHKEPWRGKGEKDTPNKKKPNGVARYALDWGKREYNPAGRNLRNVWTIATEPTPEAHFATFPQELVKKCILAGTSEKGCCPECGSPWVRVVEKPQIQRDGVYEGSKFKEKEKNYSHKRLQMMVKAGREAGLNHDNPILPSKTIGWKPSCKCNTKPIPCTVLDPFSGSGKTGIVAKKFGRKAILIDLKQEYLEMPLRKVAQEVIEFA